MRIYWVSKEPCLNKEKLMAAQMSDKMSDDKMNHYRAEVTLGLHYVKQTKRLALRKDKTSSLVSKNSTLNALAQLDEDPGPPHQLIVPFFLF